MLLHVLPVTARAELGSHTQRYPGSTPLPSRHVDDVDPVPTGDGTSSTLSLLLDDVAGLLARWVSFPSVQALWAVGLWVAHCHALGAFESSPRLAALSPEKGSGKTRLLEVLDLLVPNPMHSVNMSAAALFRLVAAHAPTLLMDEADTYLAARVAQQHEELRGLINAGHRRGAVAYRCTVDKGVKVEEFPAFCAVAIAGIGDLPDTILDRSVVIAMKRRAPHERLEPFRERPARILTEPIRDRLADWATTAVEVLEDAYPEMPEGVVDRPADVWEPLIAIADLAGDEWPARAREACVALNAARSERDPSLGVQLLADCRRVFADKDVDRLTSSELVELLVALEEAPWADLRGQAIDTRGLAWRLKPYEVRPRAHRFGEVSGRKGYLRADFHDAWLRYLPSDETGQQGQQEQH